MTPRDRLLSALLASTIALAILGIVAALTLQVGDGPWPTGPLPIGTLGLIVAATAFRIHRRAKHPSSMWNRPPGEPTKPSGSRPEESRRPASPPIPKHKAPRVSPLVATLPAAAPVDLDTAHDTEERTVLGHIFDQTKGYRPSLLMVSLVDALAAPLWLLVPLPLKVAVDSVLGNDPVPSALAAILPDALLRSDMRLLAVVAALEVLVVIAIQLQVIVSYYMHTRVGEGLTLRFRARLFQHVQRLSFRYHDSAGVADSVYRIQFDAPSIQYLFSSLSPFVASGLTLLSAAYVMFQIDWILSVVALAVAPCLYYLTVRYNRSVRSRYVRLKELETSALSVLQEVLGAVRVVKAFGRESYESQRFVGRSGETLRHRTRLSLLEGGFSLLFNLCTAVGTALVLFVGVLHVRSGMLTLGSLLMAFTYLARLYSPVGEVSEKFATVQSSLASIDRAFTLLAEAPDVRQRPDARPLHRARGELELRDVSFAYEARSPVLDGVSLQIEPGTRVGIAGTTGVGKSTLLSLLPRFYDPDGGQILLDGVDLRDYKLADLRNQFSIVLQDPVLFASTIAENIAYGRPGASEEEIVAAAIAADAHDFILSFPQGYNTLVGERGMRLSGGERQRISLARAFLKDAPVLLLDEPTSSVDKKTERSILAAMGRLMEGRTALLIAHRMTTLTRCDVIFTIEDGRIAINPRVRKKGSAGIIGQNGAHPAHHPEKTAALSAGHK